ncbi:unnamed protein product [Moneuplotes crassus]|uniref:Uncharacterized protein n=1 Tax=Euplotes crassus TaxID=5936 RepID=A0AAD2CVN5_EUPCR|nr:unnamed protein product [Moneuplotes crassus]
MPPLSASKTPNSNLALKTGKQPKVSYILHRDSSPSSKISKKFYFSSRAPKGSSAAFGSENQEHAYDDKKKKGARSTQWRWKNVRKRNIPSPDPVFSNRDTSLQSLKSSQSRMAWSHKRPFRCGARKEPKSKGILSDPCILFKEDKSRVAVLDNFKAINKLLRNGFINSENARRDVKNNLISREEYHESIIQMGKVQKLLQYMKRLTCPRNTKIVKVSKS